MMPFACDVSSRFSSVHCSRVGVLPQTKAPQGFKPLGSSQVSLGSLAVIRGSIYSVPFSEIICHFNYFGASYY